MKAAELLKIVKRHRGPILITAVGPIEGMSVQVVKADLVWKLENNFEADEETGFEAFKYESSPNRLYIDRSY